MAKDDYFVLVYQLLKYLSECLKDRRKFNVEVLSSDHLGIREEYFRYIITHLYRDGYIENVRFIKLDGHDDLIDLQNVQITPKGLQYLEENSTFEKVKNALKEITAVVPYI